jgi:glutamate dehydrogenase (NAD(P)+)
MSNIVNTAAVAKKSMYDTVLEQFNATADKISLNPNIRKILAMTNNEIIVHFPVKLDDGRVETFKGYRVQHNNILGPYKGGLALPSVTGDRRCQRRLPCG